MPEKVPGAVVARPGRWVPSELLPGAERALDGGGTAMADQAVRARRVTAPDVLARKGGDAPLVMVTAYDAPSARVVDAAGADMILVGDTLALVVLGYDDTPHVTTAARA